jgi:hypothetical protein
MPHVADQAELDALRAFYPLRTYILAPYHSQAHNRMDDAEVVDFVRRYRPELADALRAAGAVVYVHSLAGPADIQRFWDLGVGVYTDEPFPPLSAGSPVLRTPAFDDAGADRPPA